MAFAVKHFGRMNLYINHSASVAPHPSSARYSFVRHVSARSYGLGDQSETKRHGRECRRSLVCENGRYSAFAFRRGYLVQFFVFVATVVLVHLMLRTGVYGLSCVGPSVVTCG
jgi:hypothetical protein